MPAELSDPGEKVRKQNEELKATEIFTPITPLEGDSCFLGVFGGQNAPQWPH
jgi:hypothetical protein